MKKQIVKNDDESLKVKDWELAVIDAVGDVIEFWGFKRNQGRVWAFLYMRNIPMSSVELQKALDLSKGGVSIIIRELELWQVIKKVRVPGSSVWWYSAETDMLKMITKVLREREANIVSRAASNLEKAKRLAAKDKTVSRKIMERINNMYRLSTTMEKAVNIFIQTARLDITGVTKVLLG